SDGEVPTPPGDAPTTLDCPALEEHEPSRVQRHEVIEGVLLITLLPSQLDGDADIEALRATLIAMYEGGMPRQVVVNLEHVLHLSSRAIGVLVAHHLRLDREGGALRLCQVHARVALALEQIKLPMLVEVYPSTDEAVLSAWAH